ncbi:LuxR C-terminal-related transcriptional regulator [Acidiferrimicrobium sp. IK]|nr:LuxR C-terminal-related transcriptional regulator [Acidiferrimicrobium sp. IK]
MLDEARLGTSGVLVVRGPAGIGKSALLDLAAGVATGFRVARATGIESEMELAYAGLHQLCGPLVDGLGRLPGPQREALETVFGLAQGPPPDALLVGLATLGLLADAGERRPLLCLVDDAQWLDYASARAITFAARRLDADRVAIVFGVREPAGRDDLASLPTLDLEGLSDVDARALLASAVAGRLDDTVAARIVAEAEGNPLALLELPRARRPADLAGGFAVTSTSLPRRLEAYFLDRAEHLPPETRRLLLLAATESVGDAAVLARAASLLDLPESAAGPAEDEGLIDLNGKVRFRHPLVRSAIYNAATPTRLREAHAALAEAIDPAIDPDRRAWHRGEAAVGPDEAVAAELESSAQRAKTRGGVAAEAAFLERSAELTPDQDRRVERAIAAAQAKYNAGAPESALQLIALALSGPVNELQRARAERVQAQVALFQQRTTHAALLLIDATSRLERLFPALARATYLDALWMALGAGRATARGVVEAMPVRAPSHEPSPTELLITGCIHFMIDGFPRGVDLLQRAKRAFVDELPAASDPDAIALAYQVAYADWDDESMYLLASRWVSLARETGALATLPVALGFLSDCQFHAGDLGRAISTMEEASLIADAAGSAGAITALGRGRQWLALYQSEDDSAAKRVAVVLRDAVDAGDDRLRTTAEVSAMRAYNCLGLHEDALAVGLSHCERHPYAGDGFALAEMVEAAARTGASEIAADTMLRLRERTRLSGTDCALGMEARSQALTSDDEAAEAFYREAVERLHRTRMKLELARTQLAYGEWLRRVRRRNDAQQQLAVANDTFDAMGSPLLAQRARRELLASGAALPRGRDRLVAGLTAQEAVVGRLASEGRTNREIAAQLFLSPHTVDFHLRKVFRKLGINGRRQLTAALIDRVGAPVGDDA